MVKSDVAEVEQVLQTYFDGLYEGDTHKLGAAFHPMSHLYSVGADGKAADFPRADWFKRDRIVSIDFSGPGTAFAKVECQLPPSYFTDYLTLVKADGRWQVISKTFHTVRKDAADG